MDPILLIVFLPLLAAIIAGLGNRMLSNSVAKSLTTGSLATSAFDRPSATSAAIRRSTSVSSVPLATRPPMRAASLRARSAHSGAGRDSKIASASARV